MTNREDLAGRIMHRHEMTRAELADCCEANAAAMLPGSNLRDLLEHAAAALRQSPSVGEVAAIIRKHAVSSGGEPCTPRESVTAAQAIVALCQAQSRKDSPND